MPSSHDYIKDKRNKNIKIFINDKFYTRDKAKISVFDSGFLLGDGVWSGIRYHNNKFLFLKIKPLTDSRVIDEKIPSEIQADGTCTYIILTLSPCK